MKTRLPLLVCCLIAFASQAQQTKVQMWKWTDANGVVHYSDVPGPGAVQMDIHVSGARSSGVPPPDGGTAASTYEPTAQTTGYNSLAIVQPANETSYFDANPIIDVHLRSDPALLSGDSIYLLLDGKRVGNSGDALDYSLSSVPRGQHTLTAKIVDGNGEEKIQSQPVVFYMKQITVNAPAAVGPKVKPPPPPPGTIIRPPGPRPMPHAGGG